MYKIAEIAFDEEFVLNTSVTYYYETYKKDEKESTNV